MLFIVKMIMDLHLEMDMIFILALIVIKILNPIPILEIHTNHLILQTRMSLNPILQGHTISK